MTDVPTEPEAGPADRIEETDLALLGQVSAELAQVELALQRLDQDSYGRCQMCGTPIDGAVLAADPLEPFCAEHQPAP